MNLYFTRIPTCPKYGMHKEVLSLMSVNIFNAVYWWNKGMVSPMLPFQNVSILELISFLTDKRRNVQITRKALNWECFLSKIARNAYIETAQSSFESVESNGSSLDKIMDGENKSRY